MLKVEEHRTNDGGLYKGHMKVVINDSGEEVLTRHGQGVQEWQDGSNYEGGWHEGKMQG